MTSLTHPQLFGLGRNPAAPDDVLVRLAAHDHGRHGMHLRRGRLPDAVVEALLTHGGDSAFLLRGDRLSPDMLRRIEAHPDPAIRDAPAGFVRSMVENEVPIGIDSIEEAYGRPRTALAAAPDPKVRAAVAQTWWERPLAVQVTLLADPDPRVRAAAALHKKPGVPAHWWDRCLADPATRGNVARHIPLTWEQFAELTRAGEEGLLRAVAGNPHLTAEMAARLVDADDPVVRVAVARSRHADAGTRDRLYALVEAEHADGSTEAYVALHWNDVTPGWLRDAPLEERLTHLDRRDPAFRTELASCRDLPRDAWRRLDGDPDLGVRRAAARRPDVPRRSWSGWCAPTAITYGRRSSSIPTFPATGCVRSSTKSIRACVASPWRTPDSPSPHWNGSPPPRSPSCAAGSRSTRASRSRCWNDSSATRPPTSPTRPPPTPPCRSTGCAASWPAPVCDPGARARRCRVRGPRCCSSPGWRTLPSRCRARR